MKVFAAGLVVVLALSAWPLADIVVSDLSRDAAGDATRSTTGATGSAGDGRFELPFEGSDDPASSPTPPAGAVDGPSSRPGSLPASTPAATGSAVLDQVLGASRLLGHDVQVPDLPVHKLASQDPLRHAVLAWIAATNSVVPPDELARELARADALDPALQRDLALLVLSATEATLLQRAALAGLTDDEIAWIHANPQLAEDLVAGVDTPETLQLAALAAKVDTAKSVQAALLLLEAVEATRGGLQGSVEARQAVADLGLDPATRAVLDHLSQGAGPSDAEKIRFAADLVALTSGLPLERAPVGGVAFSEALQALLASTQQPVDIEQLADVLLKADRLPVDLQRALGALLRAQSRAVLAANPDLATPEGQARALVDVLDAAAYAVPILTKHNLYWTHAPEALRVGQWDPVVRAQWAAEHAALLLSAADGPSDAARAAALAAGLPLVDPKVPQRGFVDALAALSLEHGVVLTAADRAAAERAAATLDPAVRDAAALLLSGAAESMRLARLAYADLTPEERAFLLGSHALEARALAGDLSAEDLAQLGRLSALAARIDGEALAAAGVVGVRATLAARELLDNAGAYAAQGTAEPVPTGWRAFLARLLPFGTARAQAGCTDLGDSGDTGFLVVGSDCSRDVLLLLQLNVTRAHQGVNQDLLVISGAAGSTLTPTMMNYVFPRCPGAVPDKFNFVPSCTREVPAVGASRVHLDLGGDDVYLMPVATTLPRALDGFNALVPEQNLVSLHLDVGGQDFYMDPTGFVSDNPTHAVYFGEGAPHPTQGSAVGGGVAVLVDARGSDDYEADHRSQAYGRYGFAALVDLDGADTYAGGHFSQGAASEGLNVGASLLLDATGDDAYVSGGGQGYGLGGVLLDLSGKDSYQQALAPVGAPLVRLDIVPGGDVTTLDVRGDGRTWIDGPQPLNVGLGIDREMGAGGTGNSDEDRFPDMVEYLFGSDPNNGTSTPVEGTQGRVDAVRDDADKDGWPNAVERAFSTDPEDAGSYPVGFPNGAIPAGDGSPTRGDKVIDLRLPVQKAGTIEPACAARDLNDTTPLFSMLGLRVNESTIQGLSSSRTACVILGYESDGKGEGVIQFQSGTNGRSSNYTYDLPLGIFALGDVVGTKYDVDYFLAVDLGGVDGFLNGAGGALPVAFKPRSKNEQAFTDASVIGLAPSLVLNVDGQTGLPDVYDARGTTAFHNAHGSLFGVLVDTGGADAYVAGNASQGSQGGVLLDLGGKDRFFADVLSQGAGLSAAPVKAGSGHGLPDDGAAPSTDAAVRRSAPGLLLSFGTEDDLYLAGSHSQGSARGFPLSTTRTSAPLVASAYASGILYDEGGDDDYWTRPGSVNVQGVGSTHATGVLFDRAGDDLYNATGVVSHGSIVSQTARQPYDSGAAAARDPGYGILVDAAGEDIYRVTLENGRGVDRSVDRQNQTTITSGSAPEAIEGGPSVELYVERGVHMDGAEPVVMLSGAADPACQSAADEDGAARCGFYLNMPNARLAIGDELATVYDHEYALVVDLGGENLYNHSAGGLIRDVLARAAPVIPNRNTVVAEHPVVPLYPVSFLLDAGKDKSLYNASRSLVQGAGFFSVGMLVDLGGNDEFVVNGERLPALGADWLHSPPIVDGVLGGSEWENAVEHELELVSLRDARFTRSAKIRIANDADRLYIALLVPTADEGKDRLNDTLIIEFDTDHDRLETAEGGRSGIDGVRVNFSTVTEKCYARDRWYNATPRRIEDEPAHFQRNTAKVGCSIDGPTIVYEISKPLRQTSATDANADLSLRYDPVVGLTPRELGLRIETQESVASDAGKATYASDTFAWPAGTTNRDGNLTYRLDGSLGDELATWGALGVFNSSNGTKLVPDATRSSALSQGAGVGGVGILAMLGNANSSATLTAAERAQGFGAYGGLGLVIDAGGADLYQGTRLVQGAADVNGVGALIDLEGNDNYRSETAEALGYSRTGGTGVFFDLEGSDEYPAALAHVPSQAVDSEGLVDTKSDGAYPPGNQRVWVRASAAGANGHGLGVDMNSNSLLRETTSRLQGSFLGRTSADLAFYRFDGNCEDANPPVEIRDGSVVLTGAVCLTAFVTIDGDQAAGVAIDGVDFLVDGIRVTGEVDRVDFGGSSALFLLAVDTTALPESIRDDGIREVRAVTRVRDVALALGVYRDSDGAAVENVMVDNRPRPELDLAPALSIGGSDAAFSPRSATMPKALTALWDVSHDAGEDRLELFQGWELPDWGRNQPCAGNASKLCAVLPFYFHTNQQLRTEPGTNAVASTNPEAEGRGSYTGQTTTLETPLVIRKDEAFRVVLAARQALKEDDFNTSVKVVLLDSTGQEAPIPGTNTTIVLAQKYFETHRTATTTASASSLFLGAASSGGAAEQALAPLRALCAALGCELPENVAATPPAAPVGLAGTGAGNEWDELVLDITGLQPGSPVIDNGETVIVPPGYQLRVVVDMPGQATQGGLYHNTVVKPWRDAENTAGQNVQPDPVDNPNVDPLVGDPAGASGGSSSLDYKSTFQYGAPDAPSRLEVLVPTEPSTQASIRLIPSASPTDEWVLVPEALVEGGVARTAVFNGTLADEELPDGHYVAQLNTTDGAGRTVMRNSTFLLDRVAPMSFLETPSVVGRPLLSGGGDQIPLRWTWRNEISENSSGIANTYLWYRADDTNDEWKPAPRHVFVGTERGTDFSRTAGTVYDFVTISVDEVGNVEGIDAPSGPLETVLAQARDLKVAKDLRSDGTGFWRVTIDDNAPRITGTSVVPDKLLNYKGRNVLFLRPGQPASFGVSVADAGDVRRVDAVLTYAHPVTNEITNIVRNVCGESASCAGRPLVFSSWHEENTDESLFPDGVWSVGFDVYDDGANRDTVTASLVLLDSLAPTVEPQPILYPPGQAALKRNDTVRLQVRIADEFGVDDASIVADATALTTDGDAGLIDMRPRRSESGVIFQEATFQLNKPNVADGVYPVKVSLRDLAGNLAEHVFDIVVDAKQAAFVPGSFEITNVTHNNLTLEWQTTEETSSQLEYGTAPFELKGRSPVSDGFTKNHSVTLTGLQPSTRYFFRAVSTSVGGLVIRSDTFDEATRTALFLRGVSPQEGDAVSGLVPVVFDGGLLGSQDFVTYTLEARSRDDGNYSFVTTTTARGDLHQLGFNSSRYLDGDEYTLRLTAKTEKELLAIEIGPFTSDNTPPGLTVVSPLVATNDTTPRLVLDVRDELSGFAAGSLEVFVDGDRVPSPTMEVGDNAISVKHDLAGALDAGVHSFEVRVADRAGNLLHEAWNVTIDGDAPVLAVNTPAYEPGPRAARAGGLATLNVTVQDVGGIATVVADTSAVSSQNATRLFRVLGADHWIGTFPVTASDAGARIPVRVTATDLAGNAREIDAEILVDNLPPEVAEFTTRLSEHTRAVVATTATEPVLLVGTATAPNALPVTAETTELAAEARLQFAGLLPSRTYTYTVKALDQAGNSVEAAGRFQTSQDLVAPGEIGDLAVLDLLNGTLRLTWTAATDDIGVSHYRVYRSEDGVDFRPVAEVTDTFYEDAALPYERFFVYQVVAVDHGGNEARGDARLRAAATAVPLLVDGGVTPTAGSSSTTFKYTIRYQSPGGIAPAHVRIVLDGVPQEMTLVGEADYVNGALYEYATRMAPHRRDQPHTYSFEASDGRYTAKFPADGSVLRGPLVSGDLSAERESVGLAAFAKQVPLGGGTLALAGILVAALAVALVVRKKKEGSQ